MSDRLAVGGPVEISEIPHCFGEAVFDLLSLHIDIPRMSNNTDDIYIVQMWTLSKVGWECRPEMSLTFCCS